jgi:hypothetical protein
MMRKMEIKRREVVIILPGGMIFDCVFCSE